MTKTCGNCKETKPFSEFSKDVHKKDGLYTICKKCVNVRHKTYYLNNKNKVYNEIKKRKHSIPPSVYGIFLKETDECLYVGSSIMPYARICNHFSLKTTSHSPISTRLQSGELVRDKIESRILEHIKKADINRKEQEWIEKLNPRYNSLRASPLHPHQNMKHCSACKEYKSLSEFHKNISHKDGYASSCIKCSLEYKRNHYIKLKQLKVSNKNTNIDKWI